jgi:adenine-specific DNA-methyltransferase
MRRGRNGTAALQIPLLEDWDEAKLLALCIALGAPSVSPWSPAEERLCRDLPRVDTAAVAGFRAQIRSGADPLGELFCKLRSPAMRRPMGATYTPLPIVDAMVARATQVATPERIVDPGCGSARFLLASARAFPNAEMIGFEIDPTAALMARANLAAAGLADRATVIVQDFCAAALPSLTATTLFIGNPPYVRHHLILPAAKEWLVSKASSLGCRASQLAGLHVYFFLATALLGKPRDFGVYITAAEWLDVNYGSLVRELFLKRLGGTSIAVVEPTANPFPDAATTGAITTFHLTTSPPTVIDLGRAADLGNLFSPEVTHQVRRERLEAEPRWSHLTRAPRSAPADFVELGELCRVHRGTVTGANKVWIAGDHASGLPESVLFPTVTRARDIFAAGHELSDVAALRRVIDLPEDLDQLQGDERKAVDRFLRYARSVGAHLGYIARNRKAWWSVGLRSPAPILTTYMARRPPSFVRNQVAARHINIAHGLYPREELTEPVLQALVRYLSNSTSVHDGRTYAGGLTKFEPREVERLLVPRPEAIVGYN